MAVALREDSLATLGAVHLGSMREHDRTAALLCRDGERWEETPDWRLDRHVIRLGLYLAERAGVRPGERIAIASNLWRESLLVDLAAAVQGIVPVALDPDLTPDGLARALAAVAPRIIFTSDQALEQLDRAGVALGGVALGGEDGHASPRSAGEAGTTEVVALDETSAGVAMLSEVLDLGGTLDTAERAVAFRARVREVRSDRCALAWVGAGGLEGPASFRSMTHGEAAAYLRSLWSSEPARRGDLAYVSGGGSPEARLAVLAFLGDGYTTVALGTAGREGEEIAALRPHKVVVPPAALDAAREWGPHARRAGARGWIEHALLGPARYLRGSREEAGGAPARRTRWVRSTATLPAAFAPGPRGVRAAARPDLDGTRGGAT